MVRTVKKGGANVWLVEPPKSKRSSRAVPILDDDLFAAVTEHLARHPRRHDPEAAVWPGRRRGGQVGVLTYGDDEAPHYWDRVSFYRNHFRPALAGLGPPCAGRDGLGFHDLRHTAGSQWVEDGHSIVYVSRWLGHESVAFTDKVYTHLAERPDWASAVERTRAAKASGGNVVPLQTVRGQR